MSVVKTELKVRYFVFDQRLATLKIQFSHKAWISVVEVISAYTMIVDFLGDIYRRKTALKGLVLQQFDHRNNIRLNIVCCKD